MKKAIFKTKNNDYVAKDNNSDTLITVFGVNDNDFENSELTAVNGKKYIVAEVELTIAKSGKLYYKLVK